MVHLRCGIWGNEYLNRVVHSMQHSSLAIIASPEGDSIVTAREVNGPKFLDHTYLSVCVINASRCTLHVLSAI